MRHLRRLLSVCIVFGCLLWGMTGRVHAEMRVAVLYFDNHTAQPDFDALGKGLADMMITDLGTVPGLTIVERSRLEQVLTEQKLQHSKLSDPATAVKVGKLAGARYAVTGALTALDPELRVDMRMIDIQSSKVIVAEKVLGKKDAFFALEQELVRRFAHALSAKLTAAKPSSDADLGLDAALAYGQGLELADKGDLKAASKRLGEVVAKAPAFQLAQTRYKELLTRLYAVQEKRESTLQDAAQSLAEKAAAITREDPKTLPTAALGRWFAYAYLRTNLLFKEMATLQGKPPGPFSPATIPAGKLAEMKKLIKAWLANQEAIAATMVYARARQKAGDHYFLNAYVSQHHLDEDDWKREDALELGAHAHWIPFASPQAVLNTIGMLLCQGKSPFGAKIAVHMTPTPWEMDPAWQKGALSAYERALTDIEQWEDSYRAREFMRTSDKYGECLVARGRKTEGVMRWQSALEKYPASDEFEDIANKVKEALKK